MDTGTVVLARGLLLDVSGATLILVYGPSRLGLTLVLPGFLVPFAGVALQAFPLS